MVDSISKEHRSWNMSRIRGRDTLPEKRLRSLLHRAGYRFRLHDPQLPGRPDIVLKKHKLIILVNGCFWHRHPGCVRTTTPSTRTKFWTSKFKATVDRDMRNAVKLAEAGWRVITVWECDLEKNPQTILNSIQRKLKRR